MRHIMSSLGRYLGSLLRNEEGRTWANTVVLGPQVTSDTSLLASLPPGCGCAGDGRGGCRPHLPRPRGGCCREPPARRSLCHRWPGWPCCGRLRRRPFSTRACLDALRLDHRTGASVRVGGPCPPLASDPLKLLGLTLAGGLKRLKSDTTADTVCSLHASPPVPCPLPADAAADVRGDRSPPS